MASVYVDLDGTLIVRDRSYASILVDACDRVGVEAEPEALVETYTSAFLGAFKELSSAPYRDACRETVREHGLDVSPGALRDARIEAELDALAPVPGAADALRGLREAGHNLGVLSNGTGEVQRAKLDRFGLADAFDVVLVSHELGAMKPDPEIFTIARRRLPNDRYVYVGDDPSHDIEPAARLGFETVQVVEEGTEAAPMADAEITPASFERVVDLV